MAEKIEDLSASERVWLSLNLGRARNFARKYGGDPDNSTVASLAGLDAAWSAMAPKLREPGGEPNFLINAVAAAFGQRFVDELGFEWKLITDNHGTNLCVQAQPYSMIVTPTSLIAKRWNSGEDHFIASLFSVMSADIRHTREHGD